MRIVQFTRSFHLGGTEGQVLELLKGLGARHTVHVAVIQDAGPLLESVWKLGHLPRAFPLNGSVMRASTAVQVGRLAWWLRQVGAELIHAHDFYSAVIAVPAAKLAGARVVVGRLDLAHWYGPLRRAVLAQLTRAADGVVANAKAIERMLVDEEGVAPGRICVIPNGLDLAAFDRRAAAPLEGPFPNTRGSPVITLVANMNPIKRQEDLLTALSLLRETGHRPHALLVGDGVRRAELQALARGLGVEPQVHFLGHRRDVPALLHRADINVLSSAAEGLPNAVIEGMAAGLPTVATAVGGIPELVEEGVRGLLVPPHRPAALSAGLARLLGAPEAARRMGRAARAHVESALTSERLVAAHEQLYRRVLQGRPRGLAVAEAKIPAAA